jgi:hypothetical protein
VHELNVFSSILIRVRWITALTNSNNTQDFWFGELNLATAKSRVISCIDANLVIQEDEWIGAFDSSRTRFATGSRYAQTTELLVFDVASGKVTLNTDLSGLAAALKTKLGMYWIWAVEWID